MLLICIIFDVLPSNADRHNVSDRDTAAVRLAGCKRCMCTMHRIITKTLSATQGRQGTDTELDECEYTMHQALSQSPRPEDDFFGPDWKTWMAMRHWDCLDFVLIHPSTRTDKAQNLSTFCAGVIIGPTNTVSGTGTTGPTDSTDSVKPFNSGGAAPLKFLLLCVVSLAVSLVLV